MAKQSGETRDQLPPPDAEGFYRISLINSSLEGADFKRQEVKVKISEWERLSRLFSEE